MTAVSAADIRSVLSFPAPTPGPSQPRKSQVHASKKPDGISRELYSLIGPSAPSIAAHLAKPRLKQKPNFEGRGTVKWEWRPFNHSARRDSLQLYHWVKMGDPNADSAFAKYSVPPTRYSYSQDEYAQLLEDPEWTHQETDYLFDLVHEYDLRWFVIHDRYDFSGGPPRAIEDLKDRYYSCCRKLIRNREWAGEEANKSQLLNSYQFDKEREKMRKNYIESLEQRSQEEIAEEEALFIELKRLEQNERKFKKDREELLRTLLGIDSGLPDIVVVEDGPPSLSADPKKKKKGITSDMDMPSTPTNIMSSGPPILKRPQSVKTAVYDEKHCILRVEQPATSSTKITHVPVHLRSFKLPAPKAAVAPKVTQALAEIGVTYSRLVMPTRDNCNKLDSLLEATTSLIEIKKIVDKVDQDIRMLRARLGLRESEGADGRMKEFSPMHGDEVKDGTEGEVDGRAQSVASTKSARGRKQSRRSISVSSIDTSASTRTGTKRQKRN